MISPSQILTWQRCQRLWHWQRVVRPRSSGKGAELGTRLHAEMEAWVCKGTVPTHPAARAAASVWEEYARVNSGWRWQAKVELELKRGIIAGRADLVLVVAETVVDWKFLSDLKYAAQSPELPGLVPMVCYAAMAFPESQAQRRYVTLVHVSSRTKGRPLAQLAEARVHKSDLERDFQALTELARDIPTSEPTPAYGAPESSACRAYGGCPFRTQCARRDPMSVPIGFDLLCDHDKERLCKGFSVKVGEDLPPEASKTIQSWLVLPTEEELYELAERKGCPVPRTGIHPQTRASFVERLSAMPDADSPLQDDEPAPTPNPPESNGLPEIRYSPAEQPVTSVEGVGEVLATRIAEAMGLTLSNGAVPGLGVVREWLTANPKAEVRGLSTAKRAAIMGESVPASTIVHTAESTAAPVVAQAAEPSEPTIVHTEEKPVAPVVAQAAEPIVHEDEKPIAHNHPLCRVPTLYLRCVPQGGMDQEHPYNLAAWLEPLIAEIERREGKPIGAIPYGAGKSMLLDSAKAHKDSLRREMVCLVVTTENQLVVDWLTSFCRVVVGVA